MRHAKQESYEEKDYELWSTQVHVRELEEELEDNLLHNDDSSRLLEDEDIDNYYEKDKEIKEVEEDSEDEENKE